MPNLHMLNRGLRLTAHYFINSSSGRCIVDGIHHKMKLSHAYICGQQGASWIHPRASHMDVDDVAGILIADAATLVKGIEHSSLINRALQYSFLFFLLSRVTSLITSPWCFSKAYPQLRGHSRLWP